MYFILIFLYYLFNTKLLQLNVIGYDSKFEDFADRYMNADGNQYKEKSRDWWLLPLVTYLVTCLVNYLVTYKYIDHIWIYSA